MTFPPTRDEALRRLRAFVPQAGQAYGNGRNIDPGPGRPTAVSKLSPYLRHRLITEEEVIGAVLSVHDARAAEKYVQEVLWRTYWKGWLEARPTAWARFCAERDHEAQAFAGSQTLHAAQSGQTGIEGFDDWVNELVETGYLHNHARLWFASIWIFTLKLPWSLGADFFLRHLIDADAASNTLSWRWVAGLQTPGKIYLASADNIARNTNQRFAPAGLATEATAVTEIPLPGPILLTEQRATPIVEPAILLVTSEDLHPESAFEATSPFVAAVVATDRRRLWGDAARRFAEAAALDTTTRVGAFFRCSTTRLDSLDIEHLLSAATAAGVRRIVTLYAPVGPVADALAAISSKLAVEGIEIVQVRRRWDSRLWPLTTKGFFQFKARAMACLAAGDLTQVANDVSGTQAARPALGGLS
jgi:deoxyribodipyrimidine photo-lyase